MSILARILRPHRRIQVVPKDQHRITIEEWRSEPNLVSMARKVQVMPEYQMMIAALKNAHPAWNVIALDASPNISVALQRQSEGYTMALANLEALGKLQLMPERLEATFEKDDQKED